MITAEARELRQDLTRERARDTIRRIYPQLIAQRLGFVELHCALGEASAAFPTIAEKRIWVDEIRRYEEENGL